MCRIFAGQNPARYAPQVRRMRLNGQSTSIQLEALFWDILDEIAKTEGTSVPAFLSKLHGEVIELMGEPKNFTSLLRCTCITFIERRGHEQGRRQASGRMDRSVLAAE
ncbi:ribbon-helix-helix domain-containing protein [Profundibacterium mesophilum]|uniref:Ribbon-helix-helix domain-containing protein n=1 Tax=Profundibacterium mesophilum KAUST100406-0324 TaxID=1037889 RepID=A0A921NQ98_9RHOB|nr:ribbon-helix-helix domain-containing protein [Profundibacterium mesophilum]KAF0675167.1 Uncharacterized protein PMES_02535 [Profundibacterium mesophilum KAUST100406-0324]